MNRGLNQSDINPECCYELNKNIRFNRSFFYGSQDIMEYILDKGFTFSQLCLCPVKWMSYYFQVFWIWLLRRWVGGSVVGGRWVGGRWI